MSRQVPDLLFIDLHGRCTAALQDAFSSAVGVTVTSRRTNVSQAFDNCKRPVVLVDAGNSFGMMDGGKSSSACNSTARPCWLEATGSCCDALAGIDGDIAYFLSSPVDSIVWRVQHEISTRYGGEQPVGTCILVDTFNSAVDGLAYVPTMRVPGDVRDTYNAYLAFRAALYTINEQRPDTKTIVCSGLCTGSGSMPPKVAAAQMRLAWDSVHVPDRQPKPDWRHIHESNRRLAQTLRA